MAISEGIRFFQSLKGMTQKHLGVKVGFTEKTADISTKRNATFGVIHIPK